MSAVTFDVWHTLIHLLPDDEEAYYRGQVALAVDAIRAAPPDAGAGPAGVAACAEAYERALRSAEAASREGRSVGPGAQLLAAGGSLGRNPDVAEYLPRLDALVARQPFRVAPGAAEALRELRGLGYRVGVVSNTLGETGRSIRTVLERLGLAASIETFAFSEELPWTKPAPEIFLHALSALTTLPSHAIHVGDSWPDVEGARRAELRGSIYFTGLQQYGPHYQRIHVQGHASLPPPTRTAQRFPEVVAAIRELLP